MTVIADTADNLGGVALGFFCIGLSLVWWQYSIRYQLWTRKQAMRAKVARHPLADDAPGLVISRWFGAIFLSVAGIALVVVGFAHL
jgi:hypothetical protein